MLRAWQARDRYDERRRPRRTWVLVYVIATNACPSALEGRQQRPLPLGLGRASDDPRPDDPAAVVQGRGSLVTISLVPTPSAASNTIRARCPNPACSDGDGVHRVNSARPATWSTISVAGHGELRRAAARTRR